jgi:8-amino-7-oxononanoate synthase
LVAAQALAGKVTHCVLDSQAHGCLKDAARLTSLPVLEFTHRTPADLARAFRRCGPNANPVVFTDGLSPLDGSVPPLGEYLGLLPSAGLLLVDDAHGLGTLGHRGRGVLELLNLRDPRLLLTGTLSKAFGTYGGMVLGPRWIREQAVRQSRLFKGSTPLPPPLAAGALTALELMTNRGREMRARLDRQIAFVRTAFTADRPELATRPGPTLTLTPLDSATNARLRRRLLQAGIYPSYIRYAGGPADRFYRFALSTAHTRAQLTALRTVVCEFVRLAG